MFGLPSVHTDHWDPLWAALSDAELPVCLHIGSSSRVVLTSPDAPASTGLTVIGTNSMMACSDWLFSGKLQQFPNLRLAYSEGQIGWLPYVLERADDVWEEHRAWAGVQDTVLGEENGS